MTWPPVRVVNPPQRRSTILITVVCSTFAAAGGAAAGVLATQQASSPPAQQIQVASLAATGPIQATPAIARDLGRLDVAAVTAAVRGSVVSVSSDVPDGVMLGEGIGTGVILTADGQILTNAHVVDGATHVRVRLPFETEPRPATVVATDVDNDLALLAVDVDGLLPAVFADPTRVEVGDEVLAIGYALDLDGPASVTLGIVSAEDRTLVTELSVLDGLIQTDAAISSGNSGGPLVNASGHVIGINTAVVRSDSFSIASNVGFAISNFQVLAVIEQLRSEALGARRTDGYLGIDMQDRYDGGQGARVVAVEPGSPAEQAGVQIDDLVVAVGATTVAGMAGVVAAIRDHQAGEHIDLTLQRDGAVHIVTVTLMERPGESD